MHNISKANVCLIRMNGQLIGCNVCDEQGKRLGEFIWGLSRQFNNCDHEAIGLALAKALCAKINGEDI